jgi:hypothetical protein
MSFYCSQSEVVCVPSGRGRAVKIGHHGIGSQRLQGLIGTVRLIFFVLGIVGAAFAQRRPLLEYRFEEGSGTLVLNTGIVPGAIGTLWDGTSSGRGPQFSRDVPQSIGSAFSLRFDGTNDVVSIPDAFNYTVDGQPSTNPLSQLTIEAWIKPGAVGGGSRQTIWDDYGNPGVFLGLRGDLVQFTISTSSDPGVGVTTYAGKISAGVWQHVAAVYDGKQAKIYVDGQDTEVSTPASGTIQDNSYVNAARASITIGAENSSLGSDYSGSIDDLRVIPAALTRDQLARGMFAGQGTASGIPYALHDRGAVNLTTLGISPDASAGYGRVEPGAGFPAPVGVAVFGFRQNGVLVTEAGVQASGLIRSGRIPVSIGDSLDTGIAIANPFTQDVTIDFYFTDQDGATVKSGTTVITAYNQVARFLTQAPFRIGSPAQGTFTFTASGPVAATALRGLLNERDEFLITTLPVVDITAHRTDPVVVPHYADGGGWTTEIILVNPGDSACEGSMQFYDQGNEVTPGRAISISVDGSIGTSFGYSIPGRSARHMKMSNAGLSLTDPGSSLKVGSVVVTPNTDNYAPTVLVVFSHNSGGVTDTEAGVSSVLPSTAFRMYVESRGSFGSSGSIQSGFALSNPSSEPVSVNLELTTMSGEPTGLSTSMELPARGQKSMFLNQIDGFRTLPSPFQGQLRISTSAPTGLVATGLAGRFNERGDFLITTTAAADETSAPSAAELFFPQIVDGGGYSTQLILLSGSPGLDPPGRVRFFSSSGQPLGLHLR